jgi:hypothetical protein
VKNSESQNAASRSLTQTAHTISDAAEELRAALDDFAGVIDGMRTTGDVLARSTQRVEGAQSSTNRASELLASAIDRTEAATTSQQLRVDAAMGEVRTAVERMTGRIDRGLDDIEAAALASASAGTRYGGEIEAAIAQLADRLEEWSGAIAERAEAPVEQPATPEIDEAAQAEEPGSGQDLEPADEDEVEGDFDLAEGLPAEAEGALATEAASEPSPPAPEPTPAAPAPSSEVDTIPYMKAPDAKAIREAARSKGGSSNSLTGLLRPTHHSGPSSRVSDEPRAIDPAETVVLERTNAEPEDSEAKEEDGKPRRRGIFGRRK